MASETLFPTRQRCKACQKALGGGGAEVLLGLYCSARCAGMAAPVTDPTAAPRECKTQRDGQWVFKRRYRSISEIPERIREDASTDHYWCRNHCGALHIGHSRINPGTEQFRMLQNPADLADLLVKLRGHATRKQVAEVAGVRPIRLKELEEGIGHPESMATLFKVLAALCVRAGVALRT
ncbi:helix-turn-helix transcriptional regulator [Microbacterium sp. SL62]|uniref:helix-turn-helix transcriptional regulator n=1 Tax=Microbacterium sp. SL62 TaxID=2995139 RepID=UPI002276A5BA|nr:helix-turn-helix transcriptional regulator [Microbacterium sp. SL62]MCY1718483.1 helix-turn-helix transcriptional regulator [Microbacterium sp. SL62]